MKKQEPTFVYYDLEGRKREKVICPYCGKFYATSGIKLHRQKCARQHATKGTKTCNSNANDAEKKRPTQSKSGPKTRRGPYRRRCACNAVRTSH